MLPLWRDSGKEEANNFQASNLHSGVPTGRVPRHKTVFTVLANHPLKSYIFHARLVELLFVDIFCRVLHTPTPYPSHHQSLPSPTLLLCAVCLSARAYHKSCLGRLPSFTRHRTNMCVGVCVWDEWGELAKPSDGVIRPYNFLLLRLQRLVLETIGPEEFVLHFLWI